MKFIKQLGKMSVFCDYNFVKQKKNTRKGKQ